MKSVALVLLLSLPVSAQSVATEPDTGSWDYLNAYVAAGVVAAGVAWAVFRRPIKKQTVIEAKRPKIPNSPPSSPPRRKALSAETRTPPNVPTTRAPSLQNSEER